MVSTTAKREYSAATQKLLAEKSLQCVCELCDCGRHHRHEGCTKSGDKIKKVFKRPGLKECSTDYQSSYQAKPCQFVRAIMKPLPKLRNPNPPPMDFRTVTNTEYVQHEDFQGRPKPLKVEDHHSLSKEKFDGKTSYNTAFVNRGQPDRVRLTRAVTSNVGRQPKHGFSDETTHNAAFSGKMAARTMRYAELPSLAVSLLYPEPKSSNVQTENRRSYQGKYAARSNCCGPRENGIKLEGEHEHETVHRASYKKPEQGAQRSPTVHKPTLKLAERVKFEATTQAQNDFPSYRKGEFPAPAKPCPPYPATINLAVDSTHDFTTTNKELYKGQWDVGVVKTMQKESRYTPPKEKFHVTTQSMEDFKPKQITRVSFSKPVQNIAPSNVKLSDETSYKAQYPRYGKNSVSCTRYGDFHEMTFYVKPTEKFDQQGGSVTTQDFKQPEGYLPRTSYKPKQKSDENESKVTGESVYRSEYKQKHPVECTYIKYLADQKATSSTIVPTQKIVST